MNAAYDIEIRNMPAGVKARDLLAGKYKKEAAGKLVPFELATKEQKEIFAPKNLPQKSIHDYNCGARTAGAVLLGIFDKNYLIIQSSSAIFDHVENPTVEWILPD